MTARRQTTATSAEPDNQASALTMKDLLSFRVHQLANALSRGAAMRYKREFGVSLWEWRALALLGAYAPLSLNELAKAAGLDKSQVSRVVAGLIARGYVLREVDSRDGRGVRLTLTKPGQRVYAGLMRAAKERDDAFIGCLSEEEHASLAKILVKLGDRARNFVRSEQELTEGQRRPRGQARPAK